MRAWIDALAAKARHRRTPDTQMDLLKLYGIFCVVYAHCYARGFTWFGHGVESSVYVIQLFIFASGYFYKVDSDRLSPLEYLKKTAESRLLPYFVWNLIYGLLRQALAAAGVMEFGEGLSLYTLLIQPWGNGGQFMLNLPAWYLLGLFLVSMIHWLVRRLLSRRGPIGLRTDGILLGCYLVLAVGVVALSGSVEHYGMETMFLRPLELLLAFQSGIMYRAYRNRLPDWVRWPLLAGLLVLPALLQWLNGEIFQTKTVYCYFVGNPVLLMLASMGSVLLAAEICRVLAPLLERCGPVHYAGKCTMHIMFHHMLMLWGMQAVLFVWNHVSPLPGFDAAAFRSSIWYRYDFGHPAVKALYLALALVLPVVLHAVYERVLNRLSPA